MPRGHFSALWKLLPFLQSFHRLTPWESVDTRGDAGGRHVGHLSAITSPTCLCSGFTYKALLCHQLLSLGGHPAWSMYSRQPGLLSIAGCSLCIADHCWRRLSRADYSLLLTTHSGCFHQYHDWPGTDLTGDKTQALHWMQGVRYCCSVAYCCHTKKKTSVSCHFRVCLRSFSCFCMKLSHHFAIEKDLWKFCAFTIIFMLFNDIESKGTVLERLFMHLQLNWAQAQNRDLPMSVLMSLMVFNNFRISPCLKPTVKSSLIELCKRAIVPCLCLVSFSWHTMNVIEQKHETFHVSRDTTETFIITKWREIIL